ncbi:hypothetical protein T492DRAFT_225415 [Pavlovales sp. CCMP2436]|nr:hypothetical protein T492DRAFT_225415 [Pavlovales sp. CCMP2436]|mmetsp:Transcript_195/g.544  ORF Transcript_195/g.544 Transcript_195/m.544 type:complete len:297 (-) Transcript_195:57-947(-)
MHVSWPRTGKHIAFDGRWLHGAPDSIPAAPRPGSRTHPGSSRTPGGAGGAEKRCSFLVNIWLNHKPIGSERCPPPRNSDSASNSASNSASASKSAKGRPASSLRWRARSVLPQELRLHALSHSAGVRLLAVREKPRAKGRSPGKGRQSGRQSGLSLDLDLNEPVALRQRVQSAVAQLSLSLASPHSLDGPDASGGGGGGQPAKRKREQLAQQAQAQAAPADELTLRTWRVFTDGQRAPIAISTTLPLARLKALALAQAQGSASGALHQPFGSLATPTSASVHLGKHGARISVDASH